jgi:hypothetical protein
VIEDHADHVLATCKTQQVAIEWAKKHGHTAHVARVRHLKPNRVWELNQKTGLALERRAIPLTIVSPFGSICRKMLGQMLGHSSEMI